MVSSFHLLESRAFAAGRSARAAVTAEAPRPREAAPPFSLAAIPAQMLAELAPFLPAERPGVPPPSVIMLAANVTPVGLGTIVGAETRGLAPLETRGGRLDVRLRFVTWAAAPAEVDADMLALQAGLLGAESTLQGAGFIEFVAETSTSPSFEGPLSAWSRNADYRALYEYRYPATDAAESLIARIPVHADRETTGASRETAVVTDGMARWDDSSAPRLVARGRALVRRIQALVFQPGSPPSGSVTLRRTFLGVTAPPIEHPTLAAFLAAVSDPSAPQRNAQTTFADFATFLLQFAETSAPFTLGDWDADGTLDEYRNLELQLAAPVSLQSSVDRFELEYGNGEESFDQLAIAYLQVK